MEEIKVKKYLERIGYDGPLEPTAEVLKNLHACHVYAVPFENLNIHMDRPVSLDVDHIYEKVLTDRRGGYCYELNTLFATLLQHIGFDLYFSLGRVLYGYSEGLYERAQTHALVMTKIDGELWLSDVSFGNGLLESIKLDEGEVTQINQRYLVTREDDLYVISIWVKDSWSRLFATDTRPVYKCDLEILNYFSSTSDKSVFTQRPFCTLPTPTGRVTIDGKNLIERHADESVTSPIDSLEDYSRLMTEKFGIPQRESRLVKVFERMS